MPKTDIMIVEDEALIALDIEMTLQSAGHHSIRVFSDDEAPRRYLDERRPKLGLLDVNLGSGRTSVEIARALQQAGIPFLFLTGESQASQPLPDDLADRPRLDKPFSDRDLLRAVAPFLEA